MSLQNVVKSMGVCSTEGAKSDLRDLGVVDPFLVGSAGTRIGLRDSLHKYLSRSQILKLLLPLYLLSINNYTFGNLITKSEKSLLEAVSI